MNVLRRAMAIARAAYGEWNRDNATMLAAAVAFYATFSLVPLLLLLLNTAALLLGESDARIRILSLVTDTAGPRAASAIERLFEAASQTDAGATAISVVVLLAGASAVLRHLKVALNIVFDVPTRQEFSFGRFLKTRVFAALAAVAGILLLVAALAAAAVLEWIAAHAPGVLANPPLWRVIEFLATLTLLSALFAAVLKFVPDIELKWRHVAAGSTLAAVLFAAGQTVIAAFLRRSTLTTLFGAAGSVVLLLVYFYFTAALLFAAAEITEILARNDAEFRNERNEVQAEAHHTPRKEETPVAEIAGTQ